MFVVAGLLGLLALMLLLICAMVFWPRTHPFLAGGRTAEEYRAIEIANGVVFDQVFRFRSEQYDIDDGGVIAARLFGDGAARDVIVLIHGIGAAGERWNNPAGLLAGATGAQVVVLDLRGHNRSSGRRYDLNRIGQYEDDLAQVIAAIRSENPGARVWLAGHSMGGGVVLRFALKADRPQVAGYLLFAPVFGPGPTAPRSPPADPVLRIDRARMTGLILLNLAGIRRFNHLPVAYLNAPPDFPAYSFAAMASSLPLPPQTAGDGLSAMEAPFLIVAGAEDMAVYAEGYRDVVAAHDKGRVEIIPGLGHDSLLNERGTYAVITQWFRQQ
ncbi:alpha/beta hydrolase [Thalassovita mangrovi]|uniref:Alpha/beta fold hydrolase n=1 Tax=Thalassovita mangrovi TaxID=2692236 RepID=A0A6L8LWC5_9RHOB|nr:alpha/beta fold hydrolase [Thalassovita mangrovi]MYM57572.1 alpha/beta fold hydrolase [Thalassovita mangrovi]